MPDVVHSAYFRAFLNQMTYALIGQAVDLPELRRAVPWKFFVCRYVYETMARIQAIQLSLGIVLRVLYAFFMHSRLRRNLDAG